MGLRTRHLLLPEAQGFCIPAKLAATEVRKPIDPTSTAPPKQPTEMFRSTTVPIAATSTDGTKNSAYHSSAVLMPCDGTRRKKLKTDGKETTADQTNKHD